uniref:Putative secreted protein n=1 Tax=Anopheles darlingi TaxID=43151 RepID=A0A2M4D789_ANODA
MILMLYKFWPFFFFSNLSLLLPISVQSPVHVCASASRITTLLCSQPLSLSLSRITTDRYYCYSSSLSFLTF